MRSVINRAIQGAARPLGYAVVLEKLPRAPAGDLAGSKTDQKYLTEIGECLQLALGRLPGQIVEVGANFAQDATFLANAWGVDPDDVFVFEPHPGIHKRVAESYPYRAMNAAVGNRDGIVELKAVRLDAGNNGISSLLPHTRNDESLYDSVDVPLMRLDTFMSAEGLATIDFLKIDVEGLSYEVLEGLGSRLKDVVAIQLETEKAAVWQGQRTEAAVFELLRRAEFEIVHYSLGTDGVQGDSLWVAAKALRQRVYSLSSGEWLDVRSE